MSLLKCQNLFKLKLLISFLIFMTFSVFYGCSLKLTGSFKGDGYTDADIGDVSENACVAPNVMCGEVCTDTNSDPYNCGGCGKVCSGGLNADAVCINGSCSLKCKSGWTDVDGVPGCETHCEPSPEGEVCNGVDDDCDGEIDDGFPCAKGVSLTCTTGCGSEGSAICSENCQVPALCTPPDEICNGNDDNCDGQCDEVGECCGNRVEICTPHNMPEEFEGTIVCREDCTLEGPCSVKWLKVVTGNLFSCGIAVDKSLWCWGFNSSYQLGTGDTFSKNIPTRTGQVGTEWKDIGAGRNFACGILEDGTLYCWGDNSSGQLGDGTYSNSPIPRQIGNPSQWKSISAGENFVCGIKNDDSLWCWGQNTFGQLGNGSISTSNSPVQVLAGSHWKQISAGQNHVCGIDASSRVFCWGLNSLGQLGDGTQMNRNTPSEIALLSGSIVNISAGGNHTCAVKNDGFLFCWGENSNGQLGLGDMTFRTSPSRVGTDEDWVFVACGYNHTCAIKNSGQMFCWGMNLHGELGNGDASGNGQNIPVEVAGMSLEWSAASLGEYHSCAIKRYGSLFCWGWNAYGQLGVGNNSASVIPVQVGL